MRCNVLEIVPTLLSGGAEALVREHAIKTDGEKINLTTLVIWKNKSAVNDLIMKENGKNCIYIYNGAGIFYRVFNKFFGKIYIPYRIKKIIESKKIKVVHCHLHILQHIKKISSAIQNLKIFYTVHSEPSKHFLNSEEIETVKFLIKNNKFTFIALHEDMREKLNAMFNVENTVTIKNGVDFNRFRNVKESKEEIRRSLGINEKAFVVGHNGRFIPVKNHDFLLKIFINLKKINPNTHLLLIGTGPLKEKIQNMLWDLNLHDSITILSNRTDIPRLLKAMDVFVFPSIFEGLPIALVEAQVSGLKCVVSDGVSEYALLTENAIHMSLKESVSKWCDVILNHQVKNNSFHDILEYDMASEIKKLENLYLGEYDD